NRKLLGHRIPRPGTHPHVDQCGDKPDWDEDFGGSDYRACAGAANPAACKNGQTEQHEASHYDHDRAHLSSPLSEVEIPLRDAQRYAAGPLPESESPIA